MNWRKKKKKKMESKYEILHHSVHMTLYSQMETLLEPHVYSDPKSCVLHVATDRSQLQ
jgi:hypothetical protein